MKRNALRKIDQQIDMAPSHSNQLSDIMFCNELKLANINTPSNRIQRSMDVIEVGNQNIYSSESNFDCINMGGNTGSVVLHQVRDQILSDPGLISGGNTYTLG